MADIIQLLPDSIANQIAAGEVIQRPASIVKELMENAIDAGSTNIKVILKGAGKTLVQIVDDGCGMSETDARMSFERHATSKIRKTEDLFDIRTMGFRGEALASIAAVSHVEMRTRRQQDELGTRLVIEGSKVIKQEPCQCVAGTNISIKNLFYNVPARRKFLKSDNAEMRHIIDEFQRIAIAHPDLFFSLHHNNTETYHLPAGNLRQRLVGILGNHSNKKLVPLREETDILKIHGFIGKPEFSKKSRGDQFFFVNNRFIKSGYLNHAVLGAYEDLLPKDTFPLYVIFIDIDPERIDINVHPTKQEIKFDDERLVYNYLKVAVRHALGQNSITPTLDFEQEMALTHSGSSFSKTGNQSGTAFVPPTQKTGTSQAAGSSRTNPDNADQLRQNNNLKHWRDLYEGLDAFEPEPVLVPEQEQDPESEAITIRSEWSGELGAGQKEFPNNQRKPYQIHSSYIVSHIKSGFLLIDQQAAHERILYEQYLQMLDGNQVNTQQELFPIKLDISTAEAAMLRELIPQIQQLGLIIREDAAGTFAIYGLPANWTGTSDGTQLIETLLQQYADNLDMDIEINERVARSMARSAAISRGDTLTVKEMQALIDQLFACEIPFKSPFGRNCFVTYDLDELDKQFAS